MPYQQISKLTRSGVYDSFFEKSHVNKKAAPMRVAYFILFFLYSVITGGGWALGFGPSGTTDALENAALGHFDPYEQVGHVTFFQKAPEPADSIIASTAASQEVIRLVNGHRVAAGLFPLKANGILNAMAQAHSDYMRTTGCFAHQCTGEYSPAERICLSGYGMYGGVQSLSDGAIESSGGGPGPGGGSCFIGEAIAAGYPTPAGVVTGWMQSPSHYAILMHRQLREIGVGYAFGGPYKAYWTLDAGSQPNVLPVFINHEAGETLNCLVTLTLTNEEISGFGGIDYAREVAISNEPGFLGTAWEAYSPYKAWRLLEGPGSKVVYVKYRDSQGLEVLSADDIRLR